MAGGTHVRVDLSRATVEHSRHSPAPVRNHVAHEHALVVNRKRIDPPDERRSRSRIRILARAEKNHGESRRLEAWVVRRAVPALDVPRPLLNHPVPVVQDGLDARARGRDSSLPRCIRRCAGDEHDSAVTLCGFLILDVCRKTHLRNSVGGVGIGSPHVPRIRRKIRIDRLEHHLHAHVRGSDEAGVDDLRAVALQIRVRHVPNARLVRARRKRKRHKGDGQPARDTILLHSSQFQHDMHLLLGQRCAYLTIHPPPPVNCELYF